MAACYVALRSNDLDEALDRMSLRLTTRTEEMFMAPVVAGHLPSGFAVIGFRDFFPAGIKALERSPLTLYVCRVEEHVMASSLEKWQAGRRVFMVECDPERSTADGVVHCPHATGEDAEVLQRCIADSAVPQGDTELDEADHFSVAPRFIELMTGFAYDQANQPVFRVAESSRTLWQRMIKRISGR